MEKARVIVADSNSFIRRVIRQFLSHEQLDIHDAENASQMLELAATVRPGLIILEDRLTTADGRNGFKALKEDDGLKSIPVILLHDQSQSTDPELSDYYRHMAFTVLEKPLDGTTLRSSSRRALNIPAGDEDTFDDLAGSSSVWDVSKFSDEDFNIYQDFLMRKVGLFFDIKRKPDLARALNRRMKAINLASYGDYFDYLNHSSYEEKELKNLILHLTIGETTFFRSPDQFIALKGYIIPRLSEQRKSMRPPHLRIWSAGCSTGEEPYSIAIALKESMPDIDQWDVTIHATDLNNKFLKFAQRGVYPARKVRFVSQDILNRYFTFDGEGYTIAPELKKYVKFGYHNLSSDDYRQFGNIDIIFCRNVLIYFKRDRIREVIDRFRDILGDRGYLMLGYSETLFQISNDFKSIHFGDAFFYRKLAESEKSQNGDTALFWEQTAPDILREKPASSHTMEPAKFDSFLQTTGTSSSEAPRRDDYRLPVEAPIREHDADREIFKSEIKLPIEPPLPSDLDEQTMWEKGMEYYFQERFDLAEQTFKQIGMSFPTSARAALGVAFILANNGRDSRARDMLREAILMDDLVPESYYLRALLSEKDGDTESAIRDYKNVILLDPDFVMAHFNLAILYLKRGMIKDSRREFSNTLNILKRYDKDHQVKFSGGLHREALMQLCQDLEE